MFDPMLTEYLKAVSNSYSRRGPLTRAFMIISMACAGYVALVVAISSAVSEKSSAVGVAQIWQVLHLSQTPAVMAFSVAFLVSTVGLILAFMPPEIESRNAGEVFFREERETLTGGVRVNDDASMAPKPLPVRFPDTFQVFVLLPLSGEAKGDGLLQAAGILAGANLSTKVNVEFADHANNANTAARLVEDYLVRSLVHPRGPVWVICTMSGVASRVRDVVRNHIDANPEVDKYLTVFFTVAADPSAPHEPELGVIRYSIDCRDEVLGIMNTIENKLADDPTIPIMVVQCENDYSQATVRLLTQSLAVAQHNFVQLHHVRDGQGGSEIINRHDPHFRVPDRPAIAVVAGYDLELFEIFAKLTQEGFKGWVVTPATLSVPDWQSYLLNQENLNPPGVQYQCLAFAEPDPAVSRTFHNNLSHYDFLTVTSSQLVFRDDFGSPARSRFNALEQEVYRSIEPNYISALCFDCMRVIQACFRMQLMRFRSLEEIADEIEHIASAIESA